MNRLKVLIINIINKLQKKSIDIFLNVKSFFISNTKKFFDKIKHFFWILKVILTYKPLKGKPKLFLRFLHRCKQIKQNIKTFAITVVYKKIKQFSRNFIFFCVWTTYINLQKIIRLFYSIKNFTARLFVKFIEKTKLLLSAIKVFFAGLPKKLQKSTALFYNIKQFFLFLKNLSSRQTIRVDVFLIIVILILVINPFVTRNIGSSEVRSKQIKLLLSVNCEELQGSDVTKILLEEFNRQNPDIQLCLHDGQSDEEEREPDIFIFNERKFNSLFSAGKLADLSDYNIHDYSDLHESEEHQDEMTHNVSSQSGALLAANSSAQYAIPLVSFMDMLFYNIEILSAAGFDHPPKTREEYIKYTGAVSRGNFPGMAGALLSLNANDHQALSRDIFSWLWAGGVNFWQDGDKPILASSANMRAMTNDFTFLAGVYREVQTHGVFSRTGSQSLEEFAQGKTALLITSTSNIPYLRERLGDKTFGITTIPGSGAGGRYGVSLSSIYVGINSNINHADEESLPAIIRFLKFLSEKTELLCEELKAIPGSVINPIPGKYVRDDPFYSKARDIFEASSIVHGFSGKPGANKYETIFQEELRLFFEGEKNAQQTVISIQRRWDDVKIGN